MNGPCSMAMLNNQRVNPIKSHKTIIFLWFSYGFPMVFLCVYQRVSNPWERMVSSPGHWRVTSPQVRPLVVSRRGTIHDATFGVNHSSCSRSQISYHPNVYKHMFRDIYIYTYIYIYTHLLVKYVYTYKYYMCKKYSIHNILLQLYIYICIHGIHR